MKPLLTVQEAADMAQVCEATIWRALNSGGLTRKKIGNATRILTHELLDLPAPTIEHFGGKFGGRN
ncbi:helix-turn-helix domain-containing protein [Halocynthiibacter sp.]|uniref:helix-turn-helix domain-containing protein n=1 Tax=Halocynthiibacter sp. TaxID=1979210 RepID=UPI003C569F07